MKLKATINKELAKCQRLYYKHKPLIFTVASIGLGVASVGLSIPATKKALKRLEERAELINKQETKPKKILEQAKAVAPCYIPTVLTGAASIALSIGSYKVTTRRLAEACTAYHLVRRDYDDYKKHVQEYLGKNKEKKIADKVEQDKIKEDPPEKPDNMVSLNAVWFKDWYTGRYFLSTVDEVRKVEYTLDMRLQSEMFISLNEFFYELNLEAIPDGNDRGWNLGFDCGNLSMDDLIGIEFVSGLSPNGTPVLVMKYNMPELRFDYRTS